MAIEQFAGEHRFLSNFWYADVVLDGMLFPSVEHAYQAAKCADAKQRHLFQMGTPAAAKSLGRRVAMRADWETIKFGIMLDLLRQKFQRHPELTKQLLDTGDEQLVEGNHWGDRIWGVCRGVGENWLGRMLMTVRQELREP